MAQALTKESRTKIDPAASHELIMMAFSTFRIQLKSNGVLEQRKTQPS
jgi:hypothetical protein